MPFHVTVLLVLPRSRTVEVRGKPYVRDENSSVYDEHERQLTPLASTQQQV